MCLVVYIASDKELPLIAWDAAHPAFNVRPLDERGAPVRKHFTKPNVYYVGAHSGCGCGFEYGRWENEDPDESREGRKSVESLAGYLRDAASNAGDVELYACWDGDEAMAANRQIAMTPKDFARDAFWFEERTLATVRAIASE